ncbi:MAG: hypothetical protein NZU63_04285 [Gemmataceae bacterium]|nr:hypothetical protein [Gemmataceae bacterium]MDW8242498.1 hypothetical protein [Thermogemmata sp.]
MLRLFAYLWALPNTLLGCLFILPSWWRGGGIRWQQGALEVHGGLASWFLERVCRAEAMTLGHVILGRSAVSLDFCRAHEQVHVRQYCLWGPFFLPAYGLSSLWAWCRGRHPYFDNWFERQAYAKSR